MTLPTSWLQRLNRIRQTYQDADEAKRKQMREYGLSFARDNIQDPNYLEYCGRLVNERLSKFKDMKRARDEYLAHSPKPTQPPFSAQDLAEQQKAMRTALAAVQAQLSSPQSDLAIKAEAYRWAIRQEDPALLNPGMTCDLVSGCQRIKKAGSARIEESDAALRAALKPVLAAASEIPTSIHGRSLEIEFEREDIAKPILDHPSGIQICARDSGSPASRLCTSIDLASGQAREKDLHAAFHWDEPPPTPLVPPAPSEAEILDDSLMKTCLNLDGTHGGQVVPLKAAAASAPPKKLVEDVLPRGATPASQASGPAQGAQ